jgi:hypothetical protein
MPFLSPFIFALQIKMGPSGVCYANSMFVSNRGVLPEAKLRKELPQSGNSSAPQSPVFCGAKNAPK